MKEKGLKVSKIILFGSHSTGKATIDSDVELEAGLMRSQGNSERSNLWNVVIICNP